MIFMAQQLTDQQKKLLMSVPQDTSITLRDLSKKVGLSTNQVRNISLELEALDLITIIKGAYPKAPLLIKLISNTDSVKEPKKEKILTLAED